MRRCVIAALAAACGWLVGMTAIHAADPWPIPDILTETHSPAITDAFNQKPVDVVVLLGAGPDGMVLRPANVKLEKQKEEIEKLIIKRST